MIAKIYLILFHMLSGLFLSGGVLISISQFFEVAWSDEVKKFTDLWKKLSLGWVVLFIPMIFISQDLYPWGILAGHKKLYFAPTLMIARVAAFVILSIIAAYMMKRRPQISLILFVVIETFFAIDWGMSLEGNWFSNLYGPLYIVSFLLASTALLELFFFEKLSDHSKKDIAHLLLAFSIIWGYLHFSHFLIMWMSNKPSEIVFYLRRRTLELPMILLTIMFLKFMTIFAVGFSKKWKLNNQIMRFVCYGILLGQLLEMIWFMSPGFLPGVDG